MPAVVQEKHFPSMLLSKQITVYLFLKSIEEQDMHFSF